MNENRAAEFIGRVLADTAAATVVLAALGDRVGLSRTWPSTAGDQR